MTYALTVRQRRATRRAVLRLTRSPLRPATFGAGVGIGLAIAGGTIAVGWIIGLLHPITLDSLVTDLRSAPSWLLFLARVLGYLAHATVVAPVAVVVSIAARLLWGGWDVGWLLLVVLGGATAITGLVKISTDRARPDDAVISTLSSAFPSGHAVRAVALYGLLAWLVLRILRSPALRWATVLVAGALILASGAARVVVAAHWPTDVLAGFVIGALWLTFALRLLRPRTPLPRPRPPVSAEAVVTPAAADRMSPAPVPTAR